MSNQFGEYTIYKEGEKGGFGQIHLVTNNGKNIYVVKTIKRKKINPYNIKCFNKEIDIVKKLSDIQDNRYTPKVYSFRKYDNPDIIDDDYVNKQPYFVIDFYSRSLLFYYIEFLKTVSTRSFPEKYAKVIFKKILKAFEFLHKNNVCHLDIKPENILFDKEYNPIIIDFGLSEIFDDNNEGVFNGNKGTLNYKCPEMLAKKPYNGIKADIFSLGVLLFNIVTGEYGFDNAEYRDEKYRLLDKEDGNYDEYWNKIRQTVTKKSLSKEFKDLYTKMVSYYQEDRPEIKDILNHDWFKEKESCEAEIEEEIKIFLKNMYKYMHGKNFEEVVDSKKVILKGYVTKGPGKNYKYANDVFNDNNLKPKYISIDRESLNLCFLIEKYLNEKKFMKDLYEELKINEKFPDVCEVKASSESLSITIDLKSDDDEGRNTRIIIELLKYEKDSDKYLVELIRKDGSIPDYFKYYLVIREIIEKIIN